MDHVILPVQSAVPMEASQFGGDVVPHPDTLNSCPLLGVKRTSRRIIAMSAFDRCCWKKARDFWRTV